jgi:hypothetical protein
MNNKIQETQNRLIKYDYVDGTPDLAFGGLCLVMAINFIISAAFPGISSSIYSFIILGVLFCGGGVLLAWMSQRLKERVTYPRTGYVKPRGRPLKRTTKLLIRIGAPMIIILLLVLVFLNRRQVPLQGQDQSIYLNPGLMGFLLSIILALIGWKIGLPRYFLIAAAVFLISTLFLVSGVDGILGMAELSGVMSLILFTSGGVTLWKYLRNTRSPRDSQSAE